MNVIIINYFFLQILIFILFCRYDHIFLDLVEQVTQKINTFDTLNDEIYDDDVSICIIIIVYSSNLHVYDFTIIFYITNY